jgi:hypothetical protein
MQRKIGYSMLSVLPITPYNEPRYAVLFTGDVTEPNFANALTYLDVSVIDTAQGYVLSTGNPEDDAPIEEGEYLIVYGPYWDVMDDFDLLDMFKIG